MTSADEYLAKVDEFLATNPTVIAPWLTEICTECRKPATGMNIAEQSDHTFIGETTDYVIIGCKGYWQINPVALGITDLPNWHDWHRKQAAGPEPHFHSASGDVRCWCADPANDRPPMMLRASQTTAPSPRQQAKVLAFENAQQRYERRIKAAVMNLRDELDTTERRVRSAGEIDRKLIASAAHEVSRNAADLAEAATALVALLEVAPLLADTDAEK
jgi:hypothetical protein